MRSHHLQDPDVYVVYWAPSFRHNNFWTKRSEAGLRKLDAKAAVPTTRAAGPSARRIGWAYSEALNVVILSVCVHLALSLSL